MKNIPYGRQSLSINDLNAVAATLRSDWITQGPKIAEFETELARYCNVRYAVAVANGTAALHLACLAAGISEDDQVITSPITFAASANCVLYCKGKPVFVDIDPETTNIDPSKIANYLAHNHKVKAMIPVHFAGQSCDMAPIHEIAKKNKLIVIEDAAHALGARYRNEKVGSCKYSDMAIFSFHPVKSITTGEGGAITTNDHALYKKLLLLRNHGITKEHADLEAGQGSWYYEMQQLGFNYRITDFQAALGLSQLEKLNIFILKRNRIAEYYDRVFQNNPYFDVPYTLKENYSSYHIYPIRLKNELVPARKKIFDALRASGIGVQVHYIPVYLHPYYRNLGYKQGSCPLAENFYKRTISIPMYPDLSQSQAKRVIKTLFRICEEHEGL